MISCTRLGRPLSTTTRSPISTASSIEWVTNTIVVGPLLPDAQQLELQDLARLRVDRGERLVHQQHVRLDRERACEPAALLHAARHLVRIGLLEAGEPDHGDEVARGARSRRCGTPAMRSP